MINNYSYYLSNFFSVNSIFLFKYLYISWMSQLILFTLTGIHSFLIVVQPLFCHSHSSLINTLFIINSFIHSFFLKKKNPRWTWEQLHRFSFFFVRAPMKCSHNVMESNNFSLCPYVLCVCWCAFVVWSFSSQWFTAHIPIRFWVEEFPEDCTCNTHTHSHAHFDEWREQWRRKNIWKRRKRNQTLREYTGNRRRGKYHEPRGSAKASEQIKRSLVRF